MIKFLSIIKNNIDKNIFLEPNNYKHINHRNELRYYFRHESLKKCSFVYILNPSPGKSFYFTGNPSNTSTDYYGFCDYDINRNSSPGACRTILIDNIEDNLTEYFKNYWNKNTNNLPYKYIFDYMIFIYKSQWYKDYKQENKRFYFCIPYIFNQDFLKEIK